MPLTTYTAGEVLTAASLNSNLTAAGGLQFIKSQTIGTGVSTVTVTGAFSATYDAYKIVVSGGAASAATNLRYQNGASAASYYTGGANTNYAANTVTGFSANNAASIICGTTFTSSLCCDLTVVAPFLAKETFFSVGAVVYSTDGGAGAGYHNVATSYTSFVIFPQTGTLTGGTISVYGYAK
jgi:hypothetical protein